MKFHLFGENTKVEIDLLKREYPNSSDYWDGNWVYSTVKVEIPGYDVAFEASLRTDEIRDFLYELQAMNEHLSGKAVLKNLDGFLHVEGEMNRLGQIDWFAETCYPVGTGAVLQFGFASNQSYLKKLMEELEKIMKAFPVVGKP